MDPEKREINPGKELVLAMRPLGCILVVIFTIACMALMLKSGPEDIDGYVPPESDAYYAQHLDELQLELETHVFPELEGIRSCENTGNVLEIVIDSEHYIASRAVIIRYFDRELFLFVKQ